MNWADAGGISLRYVRDEGAGPTIVLLHEMGGCLESWDKVREALPGRSFIAYDARGAGLSEKPVAIPTIDDLARDLGGLLDALGVHEPVWLVGCAVGAATAIRFAADRPEQVARLILLAPATGIAAEKRPPLLALADAIEREGMRARIEARFDHSYAPRWFEGRDDREKVRARLLQADPRCYANTYRMLCALELDDALEAIRVPTLVVAGHADGTRPPAMVEAVAARITDADFRVIESGHVMPILSPALVAGLIAECLSLDASSSKAAG